MSRKSRQRPVLNHQATRLPPETLRIELEASIPRVLEIRLPEGEVVSLSVFACKLAWQRATAKLTFDEPIWAEHTLELYAGELQKMGVLGCSPENAAKVADAVLQLSEQAKNLDGG